MNRPTIGEYIAFLTIACVVVGAAQLLAMLAGRLLIAWRLRRLDRAIRKHNEKVTAEIRGR